MTNQTRNTARVNNTREGEEVTAPASEAPTHTGDGVSAGTSSRARLALSGVVAVVGCGAAKRSERAAARDLYTGSLFRGARRYVERAGLPWAILSAAHGLVLPAEPLDPYDSRLRLRGPELDRWAALAAERLVVELDARAVLCLAGVTYAAPFRAALRARGVPCLEPLQGLTLGARLAWLWGDR